MIGTVAGRQTRRSPEEGSAGLSFAFAPASVRFTVLILVTLLLLCPTGAAADETDEKDLTPGERYHRDSGLTWAGALADLDTPKPKMPSQYKRYPGAELTELPEPSHVGMLVEEAMKARRSIRTYSSAPVTLFQLSQLLFSAQGITGKAYGQYLRTAPSAGALYPFEVYVVANRVEGLERGIYHYAVKEHALELVKKGNFSGDITNAGLEQEVLGDAGVTFVLSAIFDRTRSKYGERGFRYVYIEAGHIAQNLCLQAVSLGLGSVPVGAFVDQEVNKLIGVDGLKEAAVFLLSVGKPSIDR